jgi:lipopolysaccharide/colanic/teichoic acid biosynthesis glycosyltransferase
VHRFVLLSIDLILVAAATLFALFLRDNLEFSPERTAALLPYLWLTLLSAAPVLQAAGLNRTLWRFSALGDYLRIVLAVILTVLLAVALGFAFNRMEGVARSLPILQGLLMACALIGARVAMRLRHAGRGRGAQNAPASPARQESVLVIGLDAVTELFLQAVAEYAGDRVKVAGLLGRGERHRDRLLRGHTVLGLPEDLESVLADLEVHGVRIDRIVITTAFGQLSEAAQEALLEVERTSDIELDFFAERVVLNDRGRPRRRSEEQSPPNGYQDERAAAPPVALDLEALASRPYLRWKRLIDAAAAAVAVVCLAPLILLVGVIVVLDRGPPPIFWQQRPGLRGWPFRLYKFCTMASAHDREGRRIADEDRISAVGRALRRTRLDELPQLYNILIGQMSFVGPRPLLPVDQSPAFAARLAVRPGLTGWAQIKGGRELTASDKAALDIWYVKHASLRLDLEILLGTLRMILVGERMDREAIRRARRELGLDRPGNGHGAGPPERPFDDNSHLRREDARGRYEGAGHLHAPGTPHLSSGVQDVSPRTDLS